MAEVFAVNAGVFLRGEPERHVVNAAIHTPLSYQVWSWCKLKRPFQVQRRAVFAPHPVRISWKECGGDA